MLLIPVMPAPGFARMAFGVAGVGAQAPVSSVRLAEQVTLAAWQDRLTLW